MRFKSMEMHKKRRDKRTGHNGQRFTENIKKGRKREIYNWMY